MKSLIIFTFTLILVIPAISQDEKEEQYFPKNAIYIELYGNSGYSMSFNYERRIFKNPRFSLRSGFGILPSFLFWSDFSPHGSIPLEINYIIGKKAHFFETGLGISYLFKYSSKKHIAFEDGAFRYSISPFARLGYRYSGNTGLTIRIGFTPVIDPYDNFFDPFPPKLFGGVSIGYAF